MLRGATSAIDKKVLEAGFGSVANKPTQSGERQQFASRRPTAPDLLSERALKSLRDLQAPGNSDGAKGVRGPPAKIVPPGPRRRILTLSALSRFARNVSA